MLPLVIPGVEAFDESTSEFVKTIPDQTIQLEHSLLSLSKWEAKWHKPLLNSIEKKKISNEEIVDYIRCMTLNKNVDPDAYYRLTQDSFEKVRRYLNDPMTATTFGPSRRRGKKEIYTNEVIYYMMFKYNIPIECEKWHLNRLFVLLRVASIKGGPEDKMSFGDLAKRNHEINNANRRRFGSR